MISSPLFIHPMWVFMKDESDITIRHAGLLALQRIAYLGGSFVFAAIVPRAFGPSLYGQFALIGSVSAWFALLGSMGLGQLIGRNIPRFIYRKDSTGLHEFFGQMLAARLSGCITAGACFYLFSRIFLPDLSSVILMPASGVLLVGALSELIYSFFWGLNRAAWWGMGELIRRAAQIVLIVPGFFWLGLRGAFWGMFCVELLVLAAALWRVRPFLGRLRLWPDFRYLNSYLRFGLLFSLNDLLLTLFQRSGEILVRIFTSDYAAVGQFALSYALYFSFAPAISQIILACLPAWTSMHEQQRSPELMSWIERMLTWLAAGCIPGILALQLMGNRLVPLILGASFRPVTAHLFPLLLILVLLPLTSVAGTIALMQNRPGLALQTSGGLLLSFLAISSMAIPRWGSIGACWSLLASMVLYAVHFVWRVNAIIPIPLARWAGVAAVGGFFILLCSILPFAYQGTIAWILCSSSFFGFLLFARLIKLRDAAAAWRAFLNGSGGWSLPLSDRRSVSSLTEVQ
jgi:O-antigen/teichoic acid export membrane protein